MKKKVIVACGGAVATSTIAANKVVELGKKNGIQPFGSKPDCHNL